MKIKLLHIISFGGLSNYEIRLDGGVNVLHGANESGKSSAAMFIKFVFYGLSAKSPKNGEPSERAKYINRLTGQAAGYILLETDDGTEYRLERAILTSDDAPARERVRIINRSTGESFTGQNPGEYFFGISEDVFVNTCFVGQTALIKPNAGSIGAAVENLLSSADADVDIRGAIRTIENVRREICHKNGNGGELARLREKRDSLAAEVKRSAESSASALRVGNSLNDIKKRIAELNEDKRRLDGTLSALDKIMLKRRIDSAENAEKNIATLKETLNSLDNSPIGSGFAESVDDVEREIRAYADEYAGRTSVVPDVFPSDTENDVPSDNDNSDKAKRENPTENAHRLEASSHRQFTAALAMFIAGLVGFGITLLLYRYNTESYIIPLIVTLTFVTLGGIFILQNTRTSSALSRLLDEWGTYSVEELEMLFGNDYLDDDDTEDGEDEDENEDTSHFEEDQSMMHPSELVSAQSDRRFRAAMKKADELCAAAGIEPFEDVYETLRALREVAGDVRSDREAIVEKLANLTGKLEVLNEQLDGIDRMNAEYEYLEAVKNPWGQTAASLNADGIKSLIRERDFTYGALKSAEKRKQELEAQLESIGHSSHTPDEAASALDALDRRIDELSLRRDACTLAAEALTKAGDKMRADVLPRIAESASILLSGATGGTHEAITLDKSFNAGCSTETDVLPGEYLSRGTSDIAYLSLRIALAEEIFKNETPIMIFDESFAHIDTARIEAIVSLMLDGQYLILTCRREEALAAESGGAARLEI